MLYRSLDAVDRLREEGLDVGLINKSTLNVVDEKALKEIGSTEFVLVVESLNQKTGLGSKVCPHLVARKTFIMLILQMGTWLLERDLTPRYGYMLVSMRCYYTAMLTNQGYQPRGLWWIERADPLPRSRPPLGPPQGQAIDEIDQVKVCSKSASSEKSVMHVAKSLRHASSQRMTVDYPVTEPAEIPGCLWMTSSLVIGLTPILVSLLDHLRAVSEDLPPPSRPLYERDGSRFPTPTLSGTAELGITPKAVFTVD